MPAILRIFPYQTDASLSVSGSCLSYDQGGVGSGRHPLATLGRARLRCTGPARHTGRSLRARISHDVSYQYVSASRLVSVGNGGRWSDHSGFTFPYHLRACDECSRLVGLVIITVPYHPLNLGPGRPLEAFTKHYRRTEDITHSDETMCYAGL